MNVDLEITALLQSIATLWERAGERMPGDLFPQLTLSANDQKRLKTAGRLARVGAAGSSGALGSIFGVVSIQGIKPKGASWIAPRPVSMKTPTYPAASKIESMTLRTEYRNLVAALAPAARALRPVYEQHPLAYLEGVYLLLARFGAQVAALEDVSLFDVNHVAAAVVSCLRAVNDSEIVRIDALSDKALLSLDTPFAALFGGDVSGVQEFIYGINAADNAAKALRGRSFYLQLLTDAAARYVLRELEIPITSLIYGGGAHFFLLAPRERAEGKLALLRERITGLLLEAHGSELYLALGQASVSLADFQEGKMAARWTALHADLREAKNRRYSELSAEMLPNVFASQRFARPDFEADVERGSRLTSTTAVLYGIVPIEASGDVLARLGLRVAFNAPDKTLTDADYIIRLAFTDDAPLALPQDQTPLVEGTRYMLNLVPKENTFDSLAQAPAWIDAEGRKHGITRLGVLRMDVDNLGMVFKDGLGARSTLARIAALSRTLATFFEGRVTEICRTVQSEQGANEDSPLYGVYAGGDDVFLVGAWHLIPLVAKRIRDEFSQLTFNHPAMTLSAGVFLAQEKYPSYQFASDAHDALEQSKARDGKDAITFLEETYPWNGKEWAHFTYVQGWAEKFVALGRDSAASFPMALLDHLMALETTRRGELRHVPDAKAGRYVWTGVYQLHRMVAQYDRQQAAGALVADLLRSVLRELQVRNFERLPALGMAARWAHLVLRRSSDRI